MTYFKPIFKHIQTVTEKIPEYDGEYHVTPGADAVVLQTEGKKMVDNVTVDAVEPVEEYEGQYNVTPTTTQIILPTTGKKLTDDITVDAVAEPEKYTGIYIITPQSTEQALPTAGKLMTDDVIVGAAEVPEEYTGSYTVNPIPTNQTLETANKKLTKDIIITASFEDALIQRSGSVLSNSTAKSVGQYAFAFCTSLQQVVLNAVTSIGPNAFYWCSNLYILRLPSPSVVTLENVNAFKYSLIETGDGKIYVPNNLIQLYRTATNWSTYAAKIVPM